MPPTLRKSIHHHIILGVKDNQCQILEKGEGTDEVKNFKRAID